LLIEGAGFEQRSDFKKIKSNNSVANFLQETCIFFRFIEEECLLKL